MYMYRKKRSLGNLGKKISFLDYCKRVCWQVLNVCAGGKKNPNTFRIEDCELNQFQAQY